MTAAEHGRAFFEQMATCRDACRRLGDAIHHVVGPRSVLDLGAGLGFVAGRLAELGWDATATDLYAPEDLRNRACRWLDLPSLAVPWPNLFVDAVICTETAEHIDASAADTIVANVAGLSGQIIVWSAAQPGQEWPGHVNLQPPVYWLTKFARHGFEVLSSTTLALRAEMRARHAQHEHAADNFFVLAGDA